MLQMISELTNRLQIYPADVNVASKITSPWTAWFRIKQLVNVCYMYNEVMQMEEHASSFLSVSAISKSR